MRLIDVDEIEYELAFREFYLKAKWEEQPMVWKTEIDQMPTVDAVPVIRCCDCLHFKYFENQFVQMTRCDVNDRCPDYTDFCSWAERVEE